MFRYIIEDIIAIISLGILIVGLMVFFVVTGE
jgi:hypothetical protein